MCPAKASESKLYWQFRWGHALQDINGPFDSAPWPEHELETSLRMSPNYVLVVVRPQRGNVYLEDIGMMLRDSDLLDMI